MWAQNILLAVIGLSAGVIVASGLFSFVLCPILQTAPTQANTFCSTRTAWRWAEYWRIFSGCSTYPYPVGIYWQQCSGFLVEYLWDAGRWHLQKC